MAFPEYSRGNQSLDDGIVQLVVQFYLQDGISRVSSNTKDVLKTKNEDSIYGDVSSRSVTKILR